MKLLKLLSLTTTYYLFTVSIALAAPCAADDIGCSIGSVPTTNAPFTNLGNLIGSLLQLVYYVAGIFFFINIVVGGIQWITSGGDKGGVENARNRLTNSFIGLVIVVAAYAITLIVEIVLGIKILTGFNFRAPGGQ